MILISDNTYRKKYEEEIKTFENNYHRTPNQLELHKITCKVNDYIKKIQLRKTID